MADRAFDLVGAKRAVPIRIRLFDQVGCEVAEGRGFFVLLGVQQIGQGAGGELAAGNALDVDVRSIESSPRRSAFEPPGTPGGSMFSAIERPPDPTPRKLPQWVVARRTVGARSMLTMDPRTL